MSIKYKLLLVFGSILVIITLLNVFMASSVTNRQSTQDAFSRLSRQLVLFQNDLAKLRADLTTVSVESASDEKNLRDMAVLYSQDLRSADADVTIEDAFGVNKAASLNRLQLILLSAGFSSVAVYLDNDLSHYITQEEAGMVVLREGQRVLVNTTEKQEGKINLSNWRNWSENAATPLVAPEMSPVNQVMVSFVFPTDKIALLQIVVPIQGVTRQSFKDVIVEGMTIATPETLSPNQDDDQAPKLIGVFVFSKALDNVFLEEVAAKTGLIPAIFSPDGQHQQQLLEQEIAPAELSQLVNTSQLNPDEVYIKQNIVEVGQASYYQALMPWNLLSEPALILSFSLSREGTLLKIREAVTGIIAVAAVILIVGGLAGYYLIDLLVRPIKTLTKAVSAIGVGDQELAATTEEGQFMGRIALDRLEQPIEVQSRDEIGELAVAFNAMKEQLRQFLITLEERVLERTRALETSASVSRQLTIILDISELLQQVVTLIKETFNYYHVHIYLLDESGEILEMAEGYGQAGAEMKRQRHHILLSAPKSLVARAARERQIITVENVRADPTWLPNPLLPDTHSEMAVPVVLEDQVVGVLDVQSEKVGGLTQEDEAALGTLANQVAIAVRNVRLFTQTQQALEEAQKLQRLYTVQAWESLTARRPKTEYEVCQPTLPPLQEVATPEALIALQQKRTVALQPTADGPESKDADGGTAERLPETETPLIKDQNALATPLKVSDQIIGVLGIRDDDQQRQWTEEEIALIEAISEQMSLAMENARLFEETSRRAVREQMVRQITDKIRASRDIESALRTATRELGKALVVPRAVVDLKVAPETETDASDHSQD